MKPHIEEYTILISDCFGQRYDLDVRVNAMIADGWQPLGHATPFISDSGKAKIMQTMVRYE